MRREPHTTERARMTRKDYEAIAEVLSGYRRDIRDFPSKVLDHDVIAVETVNNIAQALATVFEQDNPRFTRNRFLDACKR